MEEEMFSKFKSDGITDNTIKMKKPKGEKNACEGNSYFLDLFGSIQLDC